MGDQRGETGEIVNYIIQRKLNSTAEGDRSLLTMGGKMVTQAQYETIWNSNLARKTRWTLVNVAEGLVALCCLASSKEIPALNSRVSHCTEFKCNFWISASPECQVDCWANSRIRAVPLCLAGKVQKQHLKLYGSMYCTYHLQYIHTQSYIYELCEPYLLHNAIDGVFLPRSPVP